MAAINPQAVHNPLPLKRTNILVNSTTIAAKDTLRVAVPLQGTSPTHFANAAFSYNNINLSLTAKASLNAVYVFITNNGTEPVNISSSTLSVAIHT